MGHAGNRPGDGAGEQRAEQRREADRRKPADDQADPGDPHRRALFVIGVDQLLRLRGLDGGHRLAHVAQLLDAGKLLRFGTGFGNRGQGDRTLQAGAVPGVDGLGENGQQAKLAAVSRALAEFRGGGVHFLAVFAISLEKFGLGQDGIGANRVLLLDHAAHHVARFGGHVAGKPRGAGRAVDAVEAPHQSARDRQESQAQSHERERQLPRNREVVESRAFPVHAQGY